MLRYDGGADSADDVADVDVLWATGKRYRAGALGWCARLCRGRPWLWCAGGCDGADDVAGVVVWRAGGALRYGPHWCSGCS